MNGPVAGFPPVDAVGLVPAARPYTRPGDHLADHLTVLRHWLRAAAATRSDVTSPPWLVDERSPWTALSAADALLSARCAASPPNLVPLRTLQERFRLTPTEVRALALLVGLETDLAIRREVRTLLGGASERALPDVGAVAELLYLSKAERARVGDELGADGTLAANALILTTDDTVPLVLRGLRLDERITAFLQGRQVADRVLAPFVELATVVPADALVIDPALFAEIQALAQGALRMDSVPAPVPVMTGTAGSGRRATLAAAAASLGHATICVDVAGLPREATALRDVGRRLRREATLADALVVLVGVDRWPAGPDQPIDRALFAKHPPPLAATSGRIEGRPPSFDRGSVLVPLAAPGEADREVLWRRGLPAEASPAVARWAAERYRLTPGVIRAAATAATRRNEARAGLTTRGGLAAELTGPDLHDAVRGVLDAKLTTLGTRLAWRQTWYDLVLPDDAVDDIVEFVARVRHRRLVYETWGMARKVAKGMGLSALFSGPPGTGKTMVAGLIAQELGLDLYQIDLSKVVSKWIGETEKNLGELFDAAEAGHALLLFDEADSLFAKRTQVNTSNDRYANLEVNYLLQRLEAFTGIVILTTNHDTTIDDAFRRRLSLRIEFAMPAPPERERIWRAMLTEGPALAPDLDLASLAHRFEMSGGYIRNAALRAAFLAANDGTPITMPHLLRAARAEYQAMGKVVAHL